MGLPGQFSVTFNIFVDIEPCELEFFLFEDEVDEKMMKKLQKMGLPQIWVSFPTSDSNQLIDLGNGLFQQGDFQCSSFSVTEPTNDASFSLNYNEDKNSIIVKLEGTFFSANDPEIFDDDGETDFLLSQTAGIIQVIKLHNEKGKLIKKPKDEFGPSTPIEALAADLEYNNKGCGVRFKIHTKLGVYKDGKVFND